LPAIDLLIASQNPGKLAEMRELVRGLPFHVVSPRERGVWETPAETGDTFLENAILKGRYYSGRCGCLTLADDSGISVGALENRPGLYSSRFGGEGATDEFRNQLLLKSLEGVPAEGRGARFTCAVALVRQEAVLFEVLEMVEGQIAAAALGGNGFGYDPIFYYPPLAKTFGEMSSEEKNRISHRGKAFLRVREFLESAVL